jgi:hypothetical protein
MAALGLLDGMRFSRPYIQDNLSFLAQIAAAWAATVVVCWFALRHHARGSRPSANRWDVRRFGTGVAIVIIVVFAWAWFVRPHTEIGRQSARPAGGAFDLRNPVAPAKITLRTYSEQTVPRLNLFLGPAVMVGGIIGLALVTRRVFSNPDDPRLPFLLIFGVTTTLYVWRPSIAADMIWFLRRFLPVTIPGFILFATVATEELQRVGKRFARFGAALLMAGSLALPIALLPHYLFHSTHVPLAEGVQLACNRLGHDAAVVIVQSNQLDLAGGPQYRYPQALQAFCRVPVATAPPGLGSDFYRNLASEWAQQGRKLTVVANLPQALSVVPGTAHVLQASKYQVLEKTLKRWPTHYRQETLILFFKPVPTGV